MGIGPVRIGIVGCGNQAMEYYIPYLRRHCKEREDVEIRWISGYLEEDPRVSQIERLALETGCDAAPDDRWLDWLSRVDAVVISLPNVKHGPAIRAALENGLHVLVDKPTTINPDECATLVRLAEERGLVFITASQRRYEEVYQTVKELIERDGVGEFGLARYLMTHPYFSRGKCRWNNSKRLAGGGSLMQSGYHGLDTLLWAFRHIPSSSGGPLDVESVSARFLYESPHPVENRGDRPTYSLLGRSEDPDQVESVATLRMTMTNGGLFELTASFASPAGSIDEEFMILGSRGMIRFSRSRPLKTDMSAGTLSYQHSWGPFCLYDTTHWVGCREAPLKEFIGAVRRSRNGQPSDLISPASDSIRTLEVIRSAGQSAEAGGVEVQLPTRQRALPVHHIAIQTSRFAESVEFYRDILGLKVLERGPFKRRQMAWLQAGNTRIELFSKREGETLQPWGDFFPGPVHVAFEVDDLDRFLEEAMRRGARFHPSHPRPFTPPIAGARPIAYLLGPDGEEVEVRGRE